MIERKRGEPSTAASEWLVEFLNQDFNQHDSERDLQTELKTLLRDSQLENRLLFVADALNEWAKSGKVKPQWDPEKFSKGHYLEPGQGVYKIGRRRLTFRPWRMIEHGVRNSAFIALAYLLESGRLDRIRTCSICPRYFFAYDIRLETCSEKCRREKDKRDAPKRMKRSRAKRAKIEKEKGLPELVRLANSRIAEIREKFGNRFEEFLPYAEKIKGGWNPEKIWSALPPRLKKSL